MVTILDLWLPILGSSILVFLASSLVHMVLPWHRSDYKRLPHESETMDALRRESLAPGTYMFPHMAARKEVGEAEMKARCEKGPIGQLTIMPSGQPAMAKYMGLWFVYTLLVGIFAAYLAGRTLAAGTPYLAVFRVTGTVAFVAYGLSQFVESVWRGQLWGVTVKHIVDGLLYALLTAGCFGWLWPR